MITSSNKLISLGTVISCFFTIVGAPSAHAAYTQTGFIDRPDSFQANFNWTFPAAGQDVAGPFTGNCGDGKKCWTVGSLNSFGPAAGTKTRDLFIFPLHAPGERPADPGHGPNTEIGLLEFRNIERPVAGQPVMLTRVLANRVAHGNHSDYFTGVLKIPPAGSNLTIEVKGEHQATLRPFEASFRNFTTVPLTGAYFPSYPGSTFGDAIPFGTVQPARSADSKTLPKKDGMDPTDYSVVASGSAKTETRLAFLGTIGGQSGINELELAPMTELLATNGEFVVPMLREPDQLSSLFVFIDLVQWVGTGAMFSPLQSFSIVNGINDLLPGFFVSTSPITISPDGSFQGTPFTGVTVAAAGIDGHALPIPEPSMMLLFISGIVGLVAFFKVRGYSVLH
jgi:hypothetical protein